MCVCMNINFFLIIVQHKWLKICQEEIWYIHTYTHIGSSRSYLLNGVNHTFCGYFM